MANASQHTAQGNKVCQVIHAYRTLGGGGEGIEASQSITKVKV